MKLRGLGLVRTFQTPRPFASMTFLENVTIAALTRTNDMKIARRPGRSRAHARRA